MPRSLIHSSSKRAAPNVSTSPNYSLNHLFFRYPGRVWEGKFRFRDGPNPLGRILYAPPPLVREMTVWGVLDWGELNSHPSSLVQRLYIHHLIHKVRKSMAIPKNRRQFRQYLRSLTLKQIDCEPIVASVISYFAASIG